MTATRTTCRFTLKEYDANNRWIEIKEYEPGIPVFAGKSLGLEFRKEISFAEAREFAALLNEKLEGIVLHTIN